MRIAVLGAAGRTGSAVVSEVARRGHLAVAVARRPLPDLPPTAIAHCADVTDPDALQAALTNTDAVISAIGIGSSRKETDVYSRGARAVIDAMAVSDIKRLVVVSAAPVGPRSDHPADLEHKIAMPIVEWFFGATYRDMRRMEDVLRESTVDWVAVRPPRLLAKRGKGSYRMGPRPAPSGRGVTIADLAVALVDCAERSEPSGAVYVSN